MDVSTATAWDWYPSIDKHDTEETIKQKFFFSPSDKKFLKSINDQWMAIDLIYQHATGCLEKDLEKEKKQIRLLKIVKLTRYLEKYKVAGANAISILNATGFSFSYMDLMGIKIEQAKLKQSIFDGCKLDNANFSRVDLSYTSLNQASMKKSNLEGASFGQLPPFQHKGSVLTAIITADEKFALSTDDHYLYKWSLTNAQLMKKVKLSGAKPLSLVFSSDEKWLFLGYTNGDIEIWDYISFKLHMYQKSPDVRSFTLFKATPDRQYILTVDKSLPGGGSEVSLLKLAKNEQDYFQLNVHTTYPLLGSFTRICLSSGNAACLAVSDSDHETLIVYDPFTFEVKRKWENVKAVTALQFSPSGDKLFAASCNILHVFDLEDGERRKLFEEIAWNSPGNKEDSMLLHLYIDRIENIYFIPGESMILYTVGNSKAVIRNFDTNQVEASLRIPPSKSNSLLELNGDHLLIYNHHNNQMTCLSVKQILDQKSDQFLAPIVDVGFSSVNQKLLVIRKDPFLDCYHSASEVEKMEIASLFSEQKTIYNRQDSYHFYNHVFCRLSPRGGWLAFGEVSTIDSSGLLTALKPLFSNRLPHAEQIKEDSSEDKAQLYLVSLTQQSLYRAFKFPYDAYAISGDESHIAFVYQNTLTVIELTTGQEVGSWCLTQLDNNEKLIALSHQCSPLGYIAIRGAGATYVWEMRLEEKKLTLVDKFEGYREIGLSGNHYLFTVFGHGLFVEKMNLETLKREIFPVGGSVVDFATSPHSPYLAMCCYKPNQEPSPFFTNEIEVSLISLWEASTLKKVFEIKISRNLNRIRFSPDGTLLVAYNPWQSEYNSIYVWKIEHHALHLLWKLPRGLELNGLNVRHAKNLSDANRALLKHLKAHV